MIVKRTRGRHLLAAGTEPDHGQPGASGQCEGLAWADNNTRLPQQRNVVAVPCGAARGFSRTRHRSVPEHKTPFEKTRGMKQFTTGLWVIFGCTSQRFAVGRRHSRRSVDQGPSRSTQAVSGHRYRRGESGANDRTKAVGDETGWKQQPFARSNLGTVGSS